MRTQESNNIEVSKCLAKLKAYNQIDQTVYSDNSGGASAWQKRKNDTPQNTLDTTQSFFDDFPRIGSYRPTKGFELLRNLRREKVPRMGQLCCCDVCRSSTVSADLLRCIIRICVQCCCCSSHGIVHCHVHCLWMLRSSPGCQGLYPRFFARFCWGCPNRPR